MLNNIFENKKKASSMFTTKWRTFPAFVVNNK
jgi:hypothetical protein